MAAYVSGQTSAFVHLFERWGPRLRQMYLRHGMRGDEADDLVQQTFLHLHRARADFRAGSQLRPWLYTIALNLKRQSLRRRGRKPEVGLDPAAPEPPAPGVDPDAGFAAATIRAALERLPENQREVIVLHWFEGLSFREVGAVLGATATAVKVRAHRGYMRLRTELAAAGVTAFDQIAYGDEP